MVKRLTIFFGLIVSSALMAMWSLHPSDGDLPFHVDGIWNLIGSEEVRVRVGIPMWLAFLAVESAPVLSIITTVLGSLLLAESLVLRTPSAYVRYCNHEALGFSSRHHNAI